MMKPLLVVLLFSTSVFASDKSHCPNDSGWWFSPIAPPSVCNAPEVVHQVPEPGSLLLVVIGLAALRVVRRKK